MKGTDPFPIQAFPPRVRNAILAEFEGRHPTVAEFIRIPHAHWLTVPTIGPKTYVKLQSLTQAARAKGKTSSFATMTEADLLSHRELLHKELSRIRTELAVIRAEMLARGIPSPS